MSKKHLSDALRRFLGQDKPIKRIVIEFQDEDESHWLLASHHLFPKPDGIFLAQFGGESMDTPRPNDVEAIVALHNSWPAIHRVLLAARELARDEWDMPMPACTEELVEALRALDGGA